jgi:hypothetical protein
MDSKYWMVPGVIRALGGTLKELELQFDGGIHAKHVEVTYPENMVQSLIVHDHLMSMSDDPVMRPNIVSLIEQMRPNEFRVNKVTLYVYRRNLQTINNFLRVLDKDSLRSLEVIFEGNHEASDSAYQESLEDFYVALGSLLMLKNLTIKDDF